MPRDSYHAQAPRVTPSLGLAVFAAFIIYYWLPISGELGKARHRAAPADRQELPPDPEEPPSEDRSDPEQWRRALTHMPAMIGELTNSKRVIQQDLLHYTQSNNHSGGAKAAFRTPLC